MGDEVDGKCAWVAVVVGGEYAASVMDEYVGACLGCPEGLEMAIEEKRI